MADYIPATIIERFGSDPVGKSGKDLIYNCPECEKRVGSPDTHGNLWVSTDNFMFHCFRCEWSGGVSRKSSKGYTFEINPDSDQIANTIKKSLGLVISKESTVNYNYKIPPVTVFEVPDAMNYLLSRGITTNQMIKYNMRFSSYLDGKYKYRIIIPNRIIRKGDSEYTDMYVARKIYDSLDDLPKYLNPVGNNKSNIVFNLHTIPNRVPVIITEGVFSCISAGPNAVATYGKAVSDEQIKLIIDKEPSSIYVSLDPDAYDNFSVKLCKRIHKVDSRIPLYLIKLPDGEDPNSLGTEVYYNYVRNAQKYDPMISLLDQINNL